MSELEREIAQRSNQSTVDAQQSFASSGPGLSRSAVPLQFALSAEQENTELQNDTLTSGQEHQLASPVKPPGGDSQNSSIAANPSIQLKQPIGMAAVPPVAMRSAISSFSGLSAPPFQFKSSSIEESMKEETTVESKIKADPTGAPSNNATSSSGLPLAVQAKMEGAMGADFSNVNIHKESASATEVGALAFAQGNDVHFAPGQYNPESSSGQELIGHELAHVVQQREGRVQPTTQAKGLPVNDDPGLEAEADEMGKNAVQLKVEQNVIEAYPSTVFPGIIQKVPDGGTPSGGTTPSGTGGTAPTQSPIGGRQPTTSLDAAQQQEKDIFLQQGVYGPSGVVPPIAAGGAGYGGFDASYFPSARQLLIELRGKVRFLDSLSLAGDVVVGNHAEFAGLATVISSIADPAIREQIVAYYIWDDATQQSVLAEYIASVQSAANIWGGTNMSFFVAEPGWEDVTAIPQFDLNITGEGAVDASAPGSGASDHLQVNVYKSPLPPEISMVNDLIDSNSTVSPADDDNRHLRAYVDGDAGSSGYADSNAYNGEMNLDVNNVFNRPESDRRGRGTMLRHNVFFGNNSAEIDNEHKELIESFMSRFSDRGDSNVENSRVNLYGYASAAGTQSHNEQLVEQRLAAVQQILAGIGINNVAQSITQDANADSTSTNRGETDAAGLAGDSSTQARERRVEIRIGSGERQNTIAHELGHVFGLADEYQEGDRGAGSAAGHDQLARDAGVADGAAVENNDGIISMGNSIRPQHFSVFANALNQLTGKTWHVQS